MGEKTNAYTIMLEEHLGNQPLERPRRMWEDKMNPLRAEFLLNNI
jgi:hypothetical protein